MIVNDKLNILNNYQSEITGVFPCLHPQKGRSLTGRLVVIPASYISWSAFLRDEEVAGSNPVTPTIPKSLYATDWGPLHMLGLAAKIQIILHAADLACSTNAPRNSKK